MTLGPGAKAQLATLLEGMLGEEEPLASDVAAFFDDYLRRAPVFAAFGLRFIVWALIWSPLVFVRRPLPASSLSEPLRARHLACWAESRHYYLREGYFLVKTVALLGWGAHPVVRARFGMPRAAVDHGASSTASSSTREAR